MPRTLVLLIHGIRDPALKGLRRLIPYLQAEGLKAYVWSYGYSFVRSVAFHPFQLPLARVLACDSAAWKEEGYRVVAVCHSAGAAIAVEASKLGGHFDGLVFINGAVDRRIEVGQNTGWIINCRVPTDPALAIAKVIGLVHPFADLDGSAGNAGLIVEENVPRVDVDMTQEFGVRGHSGFFQEEKMETTGPWLAKSIVTMFGDVND